MSVQHGLARIRPRRLTCFLLVALVALAGCNYAGTGAADAPPVVSLRQPAAGSVSALGEEVHVVAHATDDKGVVRVELWIDGALTSQHESDSPAGYPSFNAAFVWRPATTGAHTVLVKAVDTAQQVTESEQVAIDVQAPPTPVPPPTTAPTPAPPTAAPTETPGPTPEADPAVTADNLTNVRNGPDTSYTKIGELTAGQTIRATGRNADGTWWQIAFPSGPDGKGWVFGELVTANDAAKSLPVAVAPPTSTAAATAVPPTSTPAPTPSVLWADRTTIAAGECTTLHWSVDNVTAVYLDDEGVGGVDQRQKCPNTTTTYSLHVWRGQSETQFQLTITVTGTVACAGEPVIDVPLGATATNVAVNEEFSVVWSVYNIKRIWIVADGVDIPEVGQGTLNGNMAFHPFHYDAPGTHTYHLKLQKCDGTFVEGPDVTVTVHSR